MNMEQNEIDELLKGTKLEDPPVNENENLG